MIGSVSYANGSRHFALITPAGHKDRAYDIFAADIWFHVAGLGSPHVGQTIEFDLAPNSDGLVVAVGIRNPQMRPPIAEPGIKRAGSHDGGAAAGGRVESPSAAAGNQPGAR
jgi:cold shock CspA family protein